MIYVKATAVGIVSGLVLAIVWAAGAVWLPILAARIHDALSDDVFGGASGYVGSGSVLLAALIGFVAGFYWTVRRARRRLPA
jgi:hypothetical protein